MQEDCKPTQRLVRLEVLAKPLKGNELAQRLMTCIAVNHNFGPNMVLAGMRDGAAVNGTAIKQMLFFYPNIMDVIASLKQSIMWDAILCSESWTHFSLLGKPVCPQL